MIYKIAILGESAITDKILDLFKSNDLDNFNNRFELLIIVSNPRLIKHFRTRFPNSRFISNIQRNEKFILASIEKLGINLTVSVQHRWILSNNFLNNVNQPVYNIHNAALPKYKGHNTISFEIMNMEKFHYTTLHIIDETVDGGLKVMQRKIQILQHDTAYSLYKKSLDLNQRLFKDFITKIDSGHQFVQKRIYPKRGYYYSKSELETLKIDFETNYLKYNIELVARALFFPPYQVAQIKFNNILLSIIPSNSFNYQSFKRLNTIDD